MLAKVQLCIYFANICSYMFTSLRKRIRFRKAESQASLPLGNAAVKSKRRYQKTAMLFSLGLHPCSKAVKSEQTLEQSGNHAIFVDINFFG